MRLLGEDLIGFRVSTGQIGLIQNNCPHRGASLFFGRNEEEGLRCVYHGWKFNVGGQCVDMPNEPADSDFKTRVEPCQFGGDPDCSRCGCIASMGLAAVGHQKLIGPITAGHIFWTSLAIGRHLRRADARLKQFTRPQQHNIDREDISSTQDLLKVID